MSALFFLWGGGIVLFYFILFLIDTCQREVDFFVFAWAVSFRPIVSIRENTLSNASLIGSEPLRAYEQEEGTTSVFKNAIASKFSHLHTQVFTSQGCSLWILNVIDYVAQLQEVINHFAQVRELAKKMLQENHYASKDIKTQKEFLDRGCRSFAMRMNRRRDIILTSLRFHKSAGEVWHYDCL